MILASTPSRLAVWIVLLGLGVKPSATQGLPTAVFLDGSGATRSLSFGISEISNAGGVLADVGRGGAGAPIVSFSRDSVVSVSSAQDGQGNVYVAGVDPIYRGVWINVLQHGTNTWAGWIAAGGNFDSVDIDIGIDGRLWIVAANNQTLSLNSYTGAAGLSGWFPINEFSVSSFPLVRAANDGSIYILSMFVRGDFETTLIRGLRVGKYLPGSGITLIKELISSASTQPTATLGSDGALYVCIKESTRVYISRFSGIDWGPKYTVPGVLTDVPRIAAGNGRIFAVALDPSHHVWTNEFDVGTGNGWHDWTYANGALETLSAAAVGDQFYVAGFDRNGDLWWYDANASNWIYQGNRGAASSFLTGSPR